MSIDYKKNDIYIRKKFSISIRKKGIGNIPIVLETFDKSLQKLLYNKELEIYMDNDIGFIRNIINHRMKTQCIYEHIIISLENGRVLNDSELLCYLYKIHKDVDNILYLLISKANLWNRFKMFLGF